MKSHNGKKAGKAGKEREKCEQREQNKSIKIFVHLTKSNFRRISEVSEEFPKLSRKENKKERGRCPARADLQSVRCVKTDKQILYE